MYRFYVNTVDGIPRSEWHLLEEHLKGTAELAKSFADEFACKMFHASKILAKKDKIKNDLP